MKDGRPRSRGGGTRARSSWAIALAAALALVALAGCGLPRPSKASAGDASASPLRSGTAPRQATPADAAADLRRAATAYDSFGRAFYRSNGAIAQFAHVASAASRPAVFWRQAELIELTEDAYLTSRDPAMQRQIVALLAGVRFQYGSTWTQRTWNDDIEWMIIAAVRAYGITGDSAYLDLARRNFDAVWARAYSSDLGGGLWWITGSSKDPPQKNVTTNATAAIAAALLEQATHDQAYLTRAKQLFAWLRGTLYDPATGQVYDNVTAARAGGSPVVNKAQLTYNQGTFVGVAGLLYQATHRRGYYRDALKAIAYTRDVMSRGGLLPAEAGGNGNLLGFKGIFVRWALDFTRANHITTFDAWLRSNAAAAWKHRDGRGLTGPDWSRVTIPSAMDSWGASSAVVLFEGLARP